MPECRSSQTQPGYAPDGSHLKVAAEHWERLVQKDLLQLSAQTRFQLTHDGRLVFKFLNRNVMVDPRDRCLKRPVGTCWERVHDPLLELISVLYLSNVQDVYPLGRDIVGTKDLREGHFFQGPHELRIAPLVERYGNDIEGFRQASSRLEGEWMDMADAAVRLKPFPRLHVYYLLWGKDEEFPARMNVLFERSIENILAADAIWALVSRVSTELLTPAAEI